MLVLDCLEPARKLTKRSHFWPFPTAACSTLTDGGREPVEGAGGSGRSPHSAYLLGVTADQKKTNQKHQETERWISYGHFPSRTSLCFGQAVLVPSSPPPGPEAWAGAHPPPSRLKVCKRKPPRRGTAFPVLRQWPPGPQRGRFPSLTRGVALPRVPQELY